MHPLWGKHRSRTGFVPYDTEVPKLESRQRFTCLDHIRFLVLNFDFTHGDFSFGRMVRCRRSGLIGPHPTPGGGLESDITLERATSSAHARRRARAAE